MGKTYHRKNQQNSFNEECTPVDYKAKRLGLKNRGKAKKLLLDKIRHNEM